MGTEHEVNDVEASIAIAVAPGREMRICVRGPVSSIHTRRWVEGLAARGHVVSYLNGSGRPQKFAGVESIDVNGGSTRLSRLLRRRKVLGEIRPDIVHQHSLPASPANLALWRMPRLVVSTWGGDAVGEDPGDDRPKPRWGRVWQRFLLAQAAAITATSQFLAGETMRLAPASASISVIPFGVDCEVFSLDRYKPVPPRETITIGFVKHLEPRYGPEQLLRVFANLARRRRNLRLVMAGNGSLRPRLKRLTAKLGLADRVSLPGPIPHEAVPSVLAGLSVFVMPSIIQESFGVAALEASAMELPVVATRVGGVPEVVLDGETGVLVPGGDWKALEEAIESLVDDAELRKRLGRAGRKWVLARYRWEESLSAMEDVYVRCVEEG